MDAKITKSRLANLLSYDWLKIIAAILAVVFLLLVFFTTIKTRARDEQIYTVYIYSTTESVSGGDPDMTLLSGDGANEFARAGMEKGIFSYDVLNAELENFGSGAYSETIFQSRRMAMQGTVMFVSDYLTPGKEAEEGETLTTTLDQLLENVEDPDRCFVLETEQYLKDCESYLVRFFGGNWREGTLDREEARACFMARNEKDNRYHLASQKEQGVKDEEARLEKLREDFIFVLDNCFATGVYTHTEVTLGGEGKEVTGSYAVNVGGLPSLRKFVYHNVKRTNEAGQEEYVQSGEDICLVLFNNDNDEGKGGDAANDLRFETISFLRYLFEEYGA